MIRRLEDIRLEESKKRKEIATVSRQWFFDRTVYRRVLETELLHLLKHVLRLEVGNLHAGQGKLVEAEKMYERILRG